MAECSRTVTASRRSKRCTLSNKVEAVTVLEHSATRRLLAVLRTWNTSELAVLRQIPVELRDSSSIQEISEADVYTRTLGIEWNTRGGDYFRLTVCETQCHTKRELVSEIAKIYDVLGWFSPSTVCMKILLQRVWERKIDWDKLVPPEIMEHGNSGVDTV